MGSKNESKAMSTVDIDKLRAEILVEFKQVHKLAPADYTENCTNVVMKLIEEHTDTLKAELLAKEEAQQRLLKRPYRRTKQDDTDSL